MLITYKNQKIYVIINKSRAEMGKESFDRNGHIALHQQTPYAQMSDSKHQHNKSFKKAVKKWWVIKKQPSRVITEDKTKY